MSPERSHNSITLEEIVSNAKEIMMRDGKHVPVLILEADYKVLAGQVPDIPPTHADRIRQTNPIAVLAGITPNQQDKHDTRSTAECRDLGRR